MFHELFLSFLAGLITLMKKHSYIEMAISPTQVLLMCMGLSRARLGGPGAVMELLLKQNEKESSNEFSMVAVFWDKYFYTYSQLSKETKMPVVDRFKPRSVGYWIHIVARHLRFLWNVRNAIKGEYSARIIHCHDFVSSYLSRLFFRRRYPIVQTIHSKGGLREIFTVYPTLRGSLWGRIARHVEQTAIRKADMVVFPSRGSRALFEAENPGLLDDKNTHIIYNGIDLEELDTIPENPATLARLDIPEGAFLLLSVAALVPEKGLDTLMQAVAALSTELRKRIRVLIIGREGPLLQQVRSLIVNNGLEETVRLIGFLERKDLVQLMRRATLFVYTPRVSVFDLVLLEVAALGTPIITTAVGGNLEMLDKESALMVPPDDPQALSEKIEQALADKELRQRIGANARIRIRTHFTLEANLNSYKALYAELLNNAKKVDRGDLLWHVHSNEV